MCLLLPAKVVGLKGDRADVELHGGMRAGADRSLVTELAVGDAVLVDRGLVIRVIEPDEAAAILQIYAEIGDLLGVEGP
jgi:hydrogenase assembly chaperone HypC/HupF